MVDVEVRDEVFGVDIVDEIILNLVLTLFCEF